jgi:pimeloyl-ACP methyl ester carboxylesterase
MQTVASKDGTSIAYCYEGAGPNLLIIGGALADHRVYEPLAQALGPHFTVFSLDRRGRGLSGDTEPYAPEREIEDLAAVMARCNGPVHLYGHSAGAALALRAAAAGMPLGTLVLADPPYSPRGGDDIAAAAAHAEEAVEIRRLIEQDGPAAGARYFLATMGVPAQELEELLESEAGASMVQLAKTLPYDYALLGDGLVPTALAARVGCPALVLAPAASPEVALQLVQALPMARFVAMDAPTHELAPPQLAALLVSLLQPPP